MDKVKYVHEPALSYLTKEGSTNHLSVVFGDSLKGRLDETNLISLSREGLPRKALDSLAHKLGISLEALSKLLYISYRTLLRKKSGDHMSVHVSEQCLAIAQVINKGLEVHGDLATFQEWIQTPLSGLNFKRPIEFLDTYFGAAMILRILGRIEYGVF